VTTTEFEALAHEAAKAQGIAGARIATVAHPIGGIGAELLLAKAESLVDDVLARLAPHQA
jgi:hypothetical protein